MTTEIVTEFLGRDDWHKEVKRKETVKEVPPDLSAIKMLLDDGVEEEELTIEELNAERKRLVELIIKEEKITKQKRKNKVMEENNNGIN